MKPQFVCGYQGCSDYLWKGDRYEVRSSAMDWRPGYWNYTPEEYANQVVACVGTIRRYSPNDQFPPEELERFFPGYVRAKFDQTTWTLVYAGKEPERVHSALYGTLAMPWYLEMKGYGWTVKEDQSIAVG